VDRILVAVDLETTGYEAETEEIIEIGAIRLTVSPDGSVTLGERFLTFANPGRPLTPPILRLTGIRDDELRNAPSSQEAVALFVNFITPKLPSKLFPITKFCVIPELFVMPTPLMVNANPEPLVESKGLIVKALAPGLNTMPLTSVSAERKTSVILEDANVAVSADPLGITSPVQLVTPNFGSKKFQSPSKGLAFQVALSAKLDLIVRIKTSTGRSQVMEAESMHGSFLAGRLVILICFVFMGSAVMDD